MSTNSLGPFSFVTLHVPHDRGGPPILPAMDGDLAQRAGVDGSSVQHLGMKGHPFQMRSGVDVVGFDVGNALMAEYRTYQNKEALTLIWGGIDYEATFSTVYLPLRVEPIRIRRIASPCGGLAGSSANTWVEAIWTLLPLAME